RQGHVDFAGHHYTVRGYRLDLPRRPNGPPIWIAGQGPRMIRLAAEWGDAFNLNQVLTVPEEAADPFAQLDAACHVIGRDPATLLRTGYVTITLTSRDIPTALHGSSDEIAAQLHHFSEAGIHHLTCSLDVGDESSPPGTLPLVTPRAIERF